MKKAATSLFPPISRDQIVLAAIGTPSETIFVPAIDGDVSAADKAITIRMFCGQKATTSTDSGIDNLIGRTCGIVLTSTTGCKGYDNPDISTVIHEGSPTSIKQLRQEMGRLRGKHQEQVQSDYFMFPNLTDYLGSRSIRVCNKSKIPGGKEYAIRKLDDVHRFMFSQGCWHYRLEEKFGKHTTHIDQRHLPNRCDGSCPHCRNDAQKNALPVDRVALTNLLTTALFGNSKISVDPDLVTLLWKDDNRCMELFKKKWKNVPRYHIETLILKLIAFGLVTIFEVEELQHSIEKEAGARTVNKKKASSYVKLEWSVQPPF